MSIPALKTILITKTNKIELYSQLKDLTFERFPYIFDISSLENQKAVIEMVENYVKEEKIKLSLYPICILSSENIHSDLLLIIKTSLNAPQFFNQKPKPLNLKENNLLAKIKLMQDKLYSLNEEETLKHLADYSETHKQIRKIEKQTSFIQHINDEIERKHVK